MSNLANVKQFATDEKYITFKIINISQYMTV